jgi:hypothetical protein
MCEQGGNPLMVGAMPLVGLGKGRAPPNVECAAHMKKSTQPLYKAKPNKI